MGLIGVSTLSVTRTATGDYGDDGVWVDGAESELTIQGTVYPAGGDVVKNLPESIRESAKYVLVTRTELLQHGSNYEKKIADVVTHHGLKYQVRGLAAYHEGPLPCFQYVLIQQSNEVVPQ